MRAIVWTGYGPPDVLQLQQVEKPVPKDNEVLIRIIATTVETGDCEMRRYQIHNYLWLPLRLYLGLLKPRIKILGQQLAGEVEAVGKDVTLFKPGDQVFAPVDAGFGTYAEYKCLPENAALAMKPDNMSYQQAAAVPVGGLNALHFIRKGNIRSGQKVLIYGSTGSIGTFAVQLARAFGAEVTAVCSTSKMELVRSLGADKLIDYTKEDFTDNGECYDVIFDTVGKSPFVRALKSLNPGGIYLLANPTFREQLRGLWASLTGSRKVISMVAGYRSEDLVYLKQLIEAGELKSVIDRSYPLEQVAEAHRYVEQGHKTGNVVITLAHDDKSSHND